jgi:hypothetical protein
MNTTRSLRLGLSREESKLIKHLFPSKIYINYTAEFITITEYSRGYLVNCASVNSDASLHGTFADKVRFLSELFTLDNDIRFVCRKEYKAHIPYKDQ